MKVPALSPEASEERARAKRVQEAIDRMAAVEHRRLERAGRARVGSHERELNLAIARQLRFCGQILAKDEKLQRRLDDAGELGSGWRDVARRIVEILKARAQLDEKVRQAERAA